MDNFEIEPIVEFQGCQTIEWLARGHVSPQEFSDQLRREYKRSVEIVDIRHEYRRNVPQGNEGMIMVRCQRGRGAYAVTVVDADNVTVMGDRP